MCGRYVSPDEAAIEREWRVGRRNSNPFPRRFNVAPTTTVPILRMSGRSREVELAAARWGFVPHWWKEAKPPKTSFNARLEEAASKPMWRDAFRRARCLIPAEGWYEWQERERVDQATGEVKTFKQPYFIRRRDRSLFCFAGLVSWWKPTEVDELQLSCSILTAAAAEALSAVHDRMPVVLSVDAHATWLDPQYCDPENVLELIRTHGVLKELEHYPVRTLVNNSSAEGPELVEAIQ